MKKTKLIVLLIAIIIPLIATAIVAGYSFNRYKAAENAETLNKFMNEEYLSNKEGLTGAEFTKKRIELNRKLTNYYYDQEPIYSKEVKASDGTVICILDIYRSLAEQFNNDTKETELDVKYEIFAYNVNYTYIQKQFEYMFDDKNIITDASAPALVVEFYPSAMIDHGQDLLEDEESVLKFDISTEVPVMDYASSPQTDKNGSYYKAQYNIIRETDLKSTKKYFSNDEAYVTLTAQIDLADAGENPDPRRLNSYFLKEEIKGLCLDGDDLDKEDMTVGLQQSDVNNKYSSLGYTTWIIKKYVWWQALIALAVSGLIMTGFYFAFTYEEPVKTKKRINK